MTHRFLRVVVPPQPSQVTSTKQAPVLPIPTNKVKTYPPVQMLSELLYQITRECGRDEYANESRVSFYSRLEPVDIWFNRRGRKFKSRIEFSPRKVVEIARSRGPLTPPLRSPAPEIFQYAAAA